MPAMKIVGRKRGIITDALGLILAVTVTTSSLSDNTIGIRLLDQAKNTYPTINKAWVDTGFSRHQDLREQGIRKAVR
jgi:hypothetical protein